MTGDHKMLGVEELTDYPLLAKKVGGRRIAIGLRSVNNSRRQVPDSLQLS